jgi:hypothetical protein
MAQPNSARGPSPNYLEAGESLRGMTRVNGSGGSDAVSWSQRGCCTFVLHVASSSRGH